MSGVDTDWSGVSSRRGAGMALTKSIGRMMFACSLALALICVVGCEGEDREEHKNSGVWFIHATDPHIFLYTAQDQDKDKKAVGEKQQQLDEKAWSDMLRHISSLTSDGHPPSFIVLTGDIGVEPCSITSVAPTPDAPAGAQVPTKNCVSSFDKKKRTDQIDHLAELLGQSPIRDIYLVAGNNDIPNEDAADIGLTYFNDFVSEVQKKIADGKKDVQLHNLTRCYVSSGSHASECIADIPNTSYCLIGYPSYSFKNHDTGAENLDPQEKQFATFISLLDAARKAGKKVLVVSHIPEMDDPFTLAQQRYAGKSPNRALDKDSNNQRDAFSAWNVSKKLLDEWEKVLASDAVVGVLAGHLHDSHKEIYRQPYAWSNTSDQSRGFSKLYLAPPLSVKNQDTSPIQARGFSLVHLTTDRIEPSLYWYNSETGAFRQDEVAQQGDHRGWFWSLAVAWLWRLADTQSPLDHMAILLIAFVAAYLTVVQIFTIPLPKDPLKGNGKTQPATGSDDSGGAKTGDASPAFNASPFASNFGKTVIGGLGGLAAETVLQSLGGKTTANDKEYYIVWFIIFLFALLILMAAFRATVEAFRARFSIGYLSRSQEKGESRAAYRFWKAWHWFFSMRFPLLAFLDTFVNLIQGKNQTGSTLTDKIVEQQRNIVRVAEAIRRQLNELILDRLGIASGDCRRPDQSDVRVNISVLSADMSNVFYIATAPGSAVKLFPKSSVAWVSVFAGKIRWYLTSYLKNQTFFEKIVLFDNSKGIIAGREETMYLKSYYQPRDEDYEAFIMFPVPWPARSYYGDHVKGAIHISFRREDQFKAIWNFILTDDAIKAKLKEARKIAMEVADAAIEGEQNEDKKTDLRALEPENIENAVQEATKKLIQDLLANVEEEARMKITREAGGAINAERDAVKKADLLIAKKVKIEKAVQEAKMLICDPVFNSSNSPPYTYQNEDRMLKELCSDVQVRVALQEAVAVLGELLNGFNENVYNSPGGRGRP